MNPGSMLQKSLATLFLLCCVLACPAPETCAQDRKILSPRDSVVLALDTNVIAISYSRPSMRGRKIMGDLVPWNRVWRTGANQATHLRTSFDMMLGGMPVPRGTYTIWTIPSTSGWTMILNKQTGQWGTQYDERQDLARFRVSERQLPAPVDTFTITLERRKASTGSISMKWERTLITVPFERRTRLATLSPPDSAIARMGNARLVVRYSRPAMRGRTVWGVVVPWDTVWRTGANLATAFETGTDITMGGVRIPRGAYTLYSIPTQETLTLVVSKQPPGALPQYDSRFDLARIPMSASTPRKPIDPFAIWFESHKGQAAALKLGWSDRVFTLPLSAH
jgi:hypothetical protein